MVGAGVVVERSAGPHVGRGGRRAQDGDPPPPGRRVRGVSGWGLRRPVLVAGPVLVQGLMVGHTASLLSVIDSIDVQGHVALA